MKVEEQSPHFAWWVERLKDSTVSPLTRDYPEQITETAVKRPIEAVETLKAGPKTEAAFRELSSLGRPDHVLLTAFVILISRLTGDEDISLAANGKPNGQAFVLRLPITLTDTFPGLVNATAKAVADAESRPTPLSAVKTALNNTALFRFAALQGNSASSTTVDGVENTDLLLDYYCGSNGATEARVRYNQRLFSSLRIAGILAQLFQLIENAAGNSSQAIGSIEFCTAEQRKLLPDPSSDLGWSSFRGAIHDIFSANAEAHPDRPCVVETRSGATPQRTFTYEQIHHSSNILAHHLVQSGIVRGEVVMIYSYRGVDLVVAVMGILKAGATFSVLDPAYPADRQNVYLEVAKPRALVIIEKATKDAGELSEKVRSFIAENLDLRTEVPALCLKDDGSLVGGEIDGKDILSHVASLKHKSPGVVVGPDSTPTLSFTSGSEGKPKGVRGRHYSLAYYFDWMAKTFKLSENDRFTMLSGIAHDPIQRDMFTPLFLGAQLLVPAKDDIQNEKLAQWMKDYGATVTHLTPAMGQILVGGASARFEKLHHAFFVGDILIKRDCRSLQNLAPNVYIVNMYGTTETQRAVSYYEIPSFNFREGFLDGMKDVIPAGRGMYNVQLLVVNRFDTSKVCAVGEIGEIYVRAGGLAEEYLGTPELTEKKFVQNWFPDSDTGLKQDKERFETTLKNEPWAEFYFGPRDRLYRSGDLGRYTPSGDVECSGRADDQVKIRGFRIELGEIDTHLSQHPLVRENVTLVRRDKFEEQTLVSYVIPNEKNWKSFLDSKGIEDQEDDGSIGSRLQRFRQLQQNVQEYLRGKLPVYAIPSLIVPMIRMPLNPNGKVDKPKLPFPDTAMLSAARRRKSSMLTQLTETELALAQLWAKLIPGTVARGIKPNDSFFDLGGNSMHAQQLPFHIRRAKGVDINISRIYSQPTLKEMAAFIDHHEADSLESVGNHPNGTSTNDLNGVNGVKTTAYGEDAIQMAEMLPAKFESFQPGQHAQSIFLTGATGFLGSYILRDLLMRKSPEVSVIVLVRAQDSAAGMNRLKATCEAYGVWDSAWTSRIECVPGDLGKPKFGLADEQWKNLCDKVEVVIHNGAHVHWIWPYESLKASNVLGTVDAIQLCASGQPKLFTFISSTSVLDSDAFVYKSEKIIAAGGEGIEESDDLSDSRTGLGTGYGQSKWVAEYLAREAGRRGLRGFIIRPGYVLGDSKSGVTNTDDFLIRMLKGCIQLGSRPNINNTVNMVPVDHVARVVVACAFNPPTSGGVEVAHVTGHPRLRFNQFLAALQTYGYDVPLTDYIPWSSALEAYVSQSSNAQFALMSLFTFVANDLPSNTRAPELDDSNAEAALYADRIWSGQDVSEGSGVTKNTIGVFLAYLVEIGFLPAPPPPSKGHAASGSGGAVKALPQVRIPPEQKRALLSVGGRGGLK